MRVGQGNDYHRLVAGRPLRLGGIEVPSEQGLEGHSDGDALLHAVSSALLGAAGLGDLGRHFPSEDSSLEGIDSAEILSRVRDLVSAAGYRPLNVDATVIAEKPRLAPHLEKMAARIADLLGLERSRVNVKATSTDRMGAIGRGEGIGATAVALLEEAPA